MIRFVCCTCYFDLMFHMKNNSPQVFYNGTSGCLVSIDKITNMKEKIERTCADFIWIQKDSIVLVCFDSVKYQIRLIDWKRFINSLLELQCFNFKKTHMCFVLMFSVKKLFLQTKCVGGVCYCVAKYFYSMSFIHAI